MFDLSVRQNSKSRGSVTVQHQLLRRDASRPSSFPAWRPAACPHGSIRRSQQLITSVGTRQQPHKRDLACLRKASRYHRQGSKAQVHVSPQTVASVNQPCRKGERLGLWTRSQQSLQPPRRTRFRWQRKAASSHFSTQDSILFRHSTQNVRTAVGLKCLLGH